MEWTSKTLREADTYISEIMKQRHEIILPLGISVKTLLLYIDDLRKRVAALEERTREDRP